MTDQILRDITRSVVSHVESRKTADCGLLSGAFGMAAYLYHAAPVMDERLTEVADRCLERVCGNLPRNIPTYCGGWAGFAVGLRLLADNGFVELEPDTLDEINAMIAHAYDTALASDNIDFLHGATGYMIYAALCGRDNPEMVRPYADRYIRWMSDNRICTDPAREAYTVNFPNLRKSPGRNISLSHGLSAVIVALSKIMALDPANDRARELLQGFVNYIRTQILDPDTLGSFTPGSPTDSGEPLRMSRMAWCYGDPGVAVGLHAAAEALGDRALDAVATGILAADASRRSYEESYLVDAPVCHGVAGIAQIYRCAAGRDRALRLARDVWRDDLNAMASRLRGRYTFYHYDADIDGYVVRHSLLEGLAGIGMVLLDTEQSNHFMDTILLLK